MTTTTQFGQTYTIHTDVEGIHFGSSATVRRNGVAIYETDVVAGGARALAQEWLDIELRGQRIGRKLH